MTVTVMSSVVLALIVAAAVVAIAYLICKVD